MTAFFERITECPRLYDGARGKDALASLTKALQGAPELAPAAKLFGESKKVRELLEAIFSASPYLTALALRHPADLAGCLLGDPDFYLGEARAGLAAAVAQASAMSEVMTLLRRFKHRMALLTGLAELGGVWPTEAALEAMSVTADFGAGASDGVSVPQGARERPDCAASRSRIAGARLFRYRHGQARRLRAELFQRHRHHRVLRRRARRTKA